MGFVGDYKCFAVVRITGGVMDALQLVLRLDGSCCYQGDCLPLAMDSALEVCAHYSTAFVYMSARVMLETDSWTVIIASQLRSSQDEREARQQEPSVLQSRGHTLHSGREHRARDQEDV